jgi:hypothetical protein
MRKSRLFKYILQIWLLDLFLKLQKVKVDPMSNQHESVYLKRDGEIKGNKVGVHKVIVKLVLKQG